MSKYASMNKGQLRQACRDNHISYADLNVEGMREALMNLEAGSAVQAPEVSEFDPERAAEALGYDTGDQTDPTLPMGENGNTLVDPPEPRVLPTINPPPSTLEPVAPVVPVGPRATSKGVKIEKDRPMQNGVKMPSAGTLCRAVWDYLQAQVDAGSKVDAKSVKAHAATVGWNPNNASIEFYNWRKYNGIKGRQS